MTTEDSAEEPVAGHRFVGTLLLSGILLYGVYGTFVGVLAAQAGTPVNDSLYIEECGACHLPYAPGLFPADNWKLMMTRLSNHFGESAELDAESHAHISSYLEANALTKGQQTRASKFLRNLSDTPVLRITELPGFIQAHEEVSSQLGEDLMVEGFLSPCEDCHRSAAEGVFDKELINQGYGPPMWPESPADNR